MTELTGMVNETVRVSFHNFNKAFVSKCYEEYEHIPLGDELKKTRRCVYMIQWDWQDISDL